MANESLFDRLEASLAYQVEGAKVDFALELKRLMDQKGLNKTRLADLLEVSRPMVTRLLSGETNVTIEAMARYAHKLDSRLFIKLGRKDDVAHVFGVVRTVERARVNERAHVPRIIGGIRSWPQPSNDVSENEAQSVAA